MTAIPDRLRTLSQQIAESLPHCRALGFRFVSIDAATATLSVPYRPDLVGDPDTGVIAGGVVTALLDQTCGQAVWAALGRFTKIVTLDLRIDYMRGAEPGLELFAAAHCYKLTPSIAFVRATAYDREPGDRVATAQATFMVQSRRRGEPAASVSPA